MFKPISDQDEVNLTNRSLIIQQVHDEHMFDIFHTRKQTITTSTMVRRGVDIVDRVLP
jgi:hypothetical protein